jgi:ParB family chromosome partitioning protein
MALRLALGERPDMALNAVTHALAAQTFYLYDEVTCLEIRSTATSLVGHADGIGETSAAKAFAKRHDAWAAQMPPETADLWEFVTALDDDRRMRLFAHCAARTAFAVRQRSDRKSGTLAAADRLADAISLDMTAHWAPTVQAYLGRITKAQIAQAVREGVSEKDAGRISSMKKLPMAEAAEELLAGTGWLPAPLRTPKAGDADAGQS